MHSHQHDAGPGAPASLAFAASRVDAVRHIDQAVENLLALLEAEPTNVGEVLHVAEQLGRVVTKVNAAHTLAIGQARDSGMWAVEGYATSASWIRHTHLLNGSHARAIELTAQWLDQHPQTREAFTSGAISSQHVEAIRRATDACPRRARAYPHFETDLLTVAANSDPQHTARVLRSWADTIDATSGDKEAAASFERRALQLSPVADGWDLRGWLPNSMGAELSGLLNEAMELRRRDSDDNALDPPATRRLDALMDLVRAAAQAPHPDGPGTFLTHGARHRARVVVTIPFQRLIAEPVGSDSSDQGVYRQLTSEPSSSPSAGAGAGITATDGGLGLDATHGGLGLDADPSSCAGSWSCQNGPGQGFLSMSDVLHLSCDAEVQRLVLGPQSQPLDIGRSTRVVPDHMRTALNQRDQGCIMPGCRRPPGWCEAHHIEHWSAGGSTSLQNLALLCSRHHHELHNGKWQITMVDGIPHATRERSSPGRGRPS